MNLIECRNLNYRIGGKELLSDISFSIEEGEFVGLLGPNGAGKSTLLSLLTGFNRPTSGELKLFGDLVKNKGTGDWLRLRRRMAMVHQHDDFNPSVPLSSREIVEIARAAGKGPLHSLTETDRKIIRKCLQKLGMEDRSSQAYRTLSGGERQKIQMARALAQEPEIMFLDEPAAGLDLDWQERLVEIIQNLFRDSSMTILMTTHITSHLPASCKRVILMNRGKIAGDGHPEEILTSGNLGRIYRCRMEVVERNGRRYCFATGAAS